MGQGCGEIILFRDKDAKYIVNTNPSQIQGQSRKRGVKVRYKVPDVVQRQITGSAVVGGGGLTCHKMCRGRPGAVIPPSPMKQYVGCKQLGRCGGRCGDVWACVTGFGLVRSYSVDSIHSQ